MALSFDLLNKPLPSKEKHEVDETPEHIGLTGPAAMGVVSSSGAGAAVATEEVSLKKEPTAGDIKKRLINSYYEESIGGVSGANMISERIPELSDDMGNLKASMFALNTKSLTDGEQADLLDGCNTIICKVKRGMRDNNFAEGSVISNQLETAIDHLVVQAEGAEERSKYAQEVKGLMKDRLSCRKQIADKVLSRLDDLDAINDPMATAAKGEIAEELLPEVYKAIESNIADMKAISRYIAVAREKGDQPLLGFLVTQIKGFEDVQELLDGVVNRIKGKASKVNLDKDSNEGCDECMTESAKGTFVAMGRVLRAFKNNELLKDSKYRKIFLGSQKIIADMEDAEKKVAELKKKLNSNDVTRSDVDKIKKYDDIIVGLADKVRLARKSLNDIESELTKVNAPSVLYWRKRILDCDALVAEAENNIDKAQMRIEVANHEISAAAALGTKDDNWNLDIIKMKISEEIDSAKGYIKVQKDLIRDLISERKMCAQKLQNAPGKFDRSAKKLIAESVTSKYVTENIAEELDHMADKFHNRALRKDEKFKKIDDELWQAQREFKVKCAKLYKLARAAKIAKAQDRIELEKEVNALSRKIEKLDNEWNARLNELEDVLPASYWKQTLTKFKRDLLYNQKMADSYEKDFKIAEEELKKLDDKGGSDSTGVIKYNRDYYEERLKHHNELADECRRLAQRCERNYELALRRQEDATEALHSLKDDDD